MAIMLLSLFKLLGLAIFRKLTVSITNKRMWHGILVDDSEESAYNKTVLVRLKRRGTRTQPCSTPELNV